MKNSLCILICDIHVKKQGHYIGFSQSILDNIKFIENQHPNAVITFLFNRGAEDLLNLQSIPIERVKYMDLFKKNTILNRFLTIQKIKTFTIKNQIDHLLLLDLDQYQTPLFFTKLKCKISGILFRPHHRIIPPNKRFTLKMQSLIKRWKKKIAEKLIVSTNDMGSIFILNDKYGADLLNRIHHTTVFQYLPDPVFNYTDYAKMGAQKLPDEFKIRFLVFGSISERKNIPNIMKAYNDAFLHLDSELLIIGPANMKYINELKINMLRLSFIDNQHKKVLIKNEFVSNEEMDYYFSISNVCLLIYRDFYGSSGLLGRAALHQLKVIGPNVGLMSELICENNMGITVDPTNINGISEALEKIYNFELIELRLKEFYINHTPEKFLSSLAGFINN